MKNIFDLSLPIWAGWDQKYFSHLNNSQIGLMEPSFDKIPEIELPSVLMTWKICLLRVANENYFTIIVVCYMNENNYTAADVVLFQLVQNEKKIKINFWDIELVVHQKCLVHLIVERLFLQSFLRRLLRHITFCKITCDCKVVF